MNNIFSMFHRTSSQVSQSGGSQSDTEEQLVVDESPKSRKHMNPSSALRLKIHANNTAAQCKRNKSTIAHMLFIKKKSLLRISYAYRKN
jgi:hypothetical protein